MLRTRYSFLSSTLLNFSSPLPEGAHEEQVAPEAPVVGDPDPDGVDDAAHLAAVPLGDLVGDEEGHVVAEDLRDAGPGHGLQCHHHKVLDLVLYVSVSVEDDVYGLLCSSVLVSEVDGSVGS